MVIKVSEGMSFTVLLYELRWRIIRISISVMIIILICMTMSINMIRFGYYQIPLLYPNWGHNISIQIINFMKETLLPKYVSLIQVAPGQAFTAQIYVAIITGVIVAMPIMLRELIAFIGPALYFQEKKIIKNIIFPSIILFTAGCFFSYYVVIPYTIEFLYKYGQSMGIASFFDITQFISFVMHMLILFGFSYQLPLLMWALTKIKIVKPPFWRNNFRYAIIILVILGAFITPDGSGVTMWFVVGPLMLLYVVGVIVVDLKFNNIIY
jgi:sec-independent protein translocase protein TatC